MSILGGCSEVTEKGKIGNSNICRDVEQKLKISMVFGMGHKRQILNISKDVEQKLMDFGGFWAMEYAGPAERVGPAGGF